MVGMNEYKILKCFRKEKRDCRRAFLSGDMSYSFSRDPYTRLWAIIRSRLQPENRHFQCHDTILLLARVDMHA